MGCSGPQDPVRGPQRLAESQRGMASVLSRCQVVSRNLPREPPSWPWFFSGISWSSEGPSLRVHSVAGELGTGFDRERYKKRNTVERAINRLKGFHAVATRYEKRAYTHLGTVTVAALIIWLRT